MKRKWHFVCWGSDSGCVCHSSRAGPGPTDIPVPIKRKFLKKNLSAMSEVSLQGAGFILFSKYLSTLAFRLLIDQIPHLQARGRQWSRGALLFLFRHCQKIHHWRISNYLLYFLGLYLEFVGSICLLGIFVWVLFGFVLRFFLEVENNTYEYLTLPLILGTDCWFCLKNHSSLVPGVSRFAGIRKVQLICCLIVSQQQTMFRTAEVEKRNKNKL